MQMDLDEAPKHSGRSYRTIPEAAARSRMAIAAEYR
jgi:hypothetical protein